MKLHQIIDAAGSRGANLLWLAARLAHRMVPDRVFHPAWSPSPLAKSRDRTRPPLGVPRQTESLCPECVGEVREAIEAGEKDWESLLGDHPGKIPATIAERDGRIIIEKDCPRHGHFEDLLSIDPDFFRRMEERFPGRDLSMLPDPLHRHGASSIRFSRGAVLTVDLTNRCNMMCDPCFMDANQVGYVHELTLEEVRKILDDAITVRPRRQLSVQFAGGEPTLSPHFLETIRHAKKLGYFSVQVATNGVRFAQDPDLARQAYDAGLKFAYLQFDGVGEEANAHRGVANLFAVKEAAIRNLHEAGVTVALVVTVAKGVNDDQLGAIYDFTMRNIEAIHTIAFQPIAFTGRDEEIDDAQRAAQRYTTSHLAHDFRAQTGLTDPVRDWYPLSATGPFSDLADLIRGPTAEWGAVRCGCHPDCGAGMMVMVNMTTKESVPVPAFLRMDRLLRDLAEISDWARGPTWTRLLAGLAFYRNFRPRSAPTGMRFADLFRQVDSHTGGNITGNRQKRFRWGLLTVAGMWFQDLWTYDFRRTEMCSVPYATQMGEISFCAYNSGVGWRKIVEKVHRTASVAEWYREKGRTPIYARGKTVPLPGDAAAPHGPSPAPLPAPHVCPVGPAQGRCGSPPGLPK